MSDSNRSMVTLCGLWSGESKSGTKYLSGNAGMAKFFIFANKNKKGERSPDYWLCLTEAPRDRDRPPQKAQKTEHAGEIPKEDSDAGHPPF